MGDDLIIRLKSGLYLEDKDILIPWLTPIDELENFAEPEIISEGKKPSGVLYKTPYQYFVWKDHVWSGLHCDIQTQLYHKASLPKVWNCSSLFQYCYVSVLGKSSKPNVYAEHDWLVSHFTNLYGSAVFFEHGSSSSCTYGSCIEHAHLHALPSAVDFKWFVTEFTETPIQDISELQEYCDNGYLYYENAEGAKLVYTTDIPIGSQYFRRIWAQTVDKEDEWDWQVFIGEEDVASTIGDLREVLSMQENGDNEED